jgi:hypothetical protein
MSSIPFVLMSLHVVLVHYWRLIFEKTKMISMKNNKELLNKLNCDINKAIDLMVNLLPENEVYSKQSNNDLEMSFNEFSTVWATQIANHWIKKNPNEDNYETWIKLLATKQNILETMTDLINAS